MEAAVESTLNSLPLPASAVLHLLSIGVCLRCIFRIFRVHGDVYSCLLPSTTTLFSLLKPLISPTEHPEPEDDTLTTVKDVCASTIEKDDSKETCIVCFGILQMAYQKQEMTIYKGKIDDMSEVVVSILDAVQHQGYQFDSFYLEVSIPPAVLKQDHALWLYMRQKYGSEIWFKNLPVMDCVPLKDALKSSLNKPLEDLLGKNLDVKSPFRIALIYKHTEVSEEVNIDDSRESSGKRRKMGESSSFQNAALSATHSFRESVKGGESYPVVQHILNTMSDNELVEKHEFPSMKLCEPCQLVVKCSRMSIYMGGRYLKYSRNVSQTRWMIDEERMGDNSVEEIIGNAVLLQLRGDSYKFHAAGREDIDVRMLGSGRPFLVEVLNARNMYTKADIMKLETKINDSNDGLVKVRELKEVGSDCWNVMREGEAEKQKQYAAVVWVSRTLSDEDVKCISEMKELEIEQRTPVRVLHRRSPLVRKRLIHWMKVERIEGSNQYFLLHLCTQAGTYIKEFVHGDLGRTYPNVGALLGCVAEILQLDVTDVKMDLF